MAFDGPALLDGVRNRDPMAERIFYDLHVAKVYQLTLRATRNRVLAEELTQETFVRVFERFSQFRGDGSVAAWVCRVAHSVTANGLTRCRNQWAHEVPWDSVRECDAIVTEPFATNHLDLSPHLAAALQAMPPAYRRAVVLYDVLGYTHRKIAAALGITVSASKTRLSRGRAQLRDRLADFVAEWAA